MGHAEGQSHYGPNHPLAGQPVPTTERHLCPKHLWIAGTANSCRTNNHYWADSFDIGFPNGHHFFLPEHFSIDATHLTYHAPTNTAMSAIGTVDGLLLDPYTGVVITDWQNGFLYWMWEGYHNIKPFGGCNWFANMIAMWSPQAANALPSHLSGTATPFYNGDPMILQTQWMYWHDLTLWMVLQSKIDWARCMWDKCCLHESPPYSGPLMKGMQVNWDEVRFKKMQDEQDDKNKLPTIEQDIVSEPTQIIPTTIPAQPPPQTPSTPPPIIPPPTTPTPPSTTTTDDGGY